MSELVNFFASTPDASAKRRWWRGVGYALLVLLGLGVAGYALVVYGLGAFWAGARDGGPPLRTAELWPRVLAAHAVSASVALVVGLWQILPLSRRWAPIWHRRLGVVYVAAVAIAGASGLFLAPWAAGGAVGRWGFAVLDVFWVTTTAQGLRGALRKDFAAHRRGMARSFAFTCAAISLRLQLFACLSFGLEFARVYPWIAWSCWVPHLIFVEGWLRRK